MKRPLQLLASILIVAGSAATVVVVAQAVGGSPVPPEQVAAPTVTPGPHDTTPAGCPTPAPLPPPGTVIDGPQPPPDLTPPPIPPECLPPVKPPEGSDFEPDSAQPQEQRIVVRGTEVVLPPGAEFGGVIGEPGSLTPPDVPTGYAYVIYGDSVIKFEGDWVEVDVKPEDAEALRPLLEALGQ